VNIVQLADGICQPGPFAIFQPAGDKRQVFVILIHDHQQPAQHVAPQVTPR